MDERLVAAALAARQAAYAPYSNFAVGAAILCADGQMFSGCNVENAAYPEGLCAEAGAIAAMVAAGQRRIAAIVIAAAGPKPCTPCGGCRQKLREFGTPDLHVVCIDPQGATLLTRSLEQLLPDSFGPGHLSGVEGDA